LIVIVKNSKTEL